MISAIYDTSVFSLDFAKTFYKKTATSIAVKFIQSF